MSRITGVETYYLNFTDSKEALDLAARENAASQRSIFELQDLLQKITLHEKLDESREFASRVQSAMFAFSARSFPGQKNRGVKKAPFVVLIGAQMPSILAEIGFVTNPREEALLKRPDYRQKLADSIYKGVAKYAESLSHFQVGAKSVMRVPIFRHVPFEGAGLHRTGAACARHRVRLSRPVTIRHYVPDPSTTKA